MELCSKPPDATSMEFDVNGLDGKVLEQWALLSKKKCNIMRFLDSVGKNLEKILVKKKNC